MGCPSINPQEGAGVSRLGNAGGHGGAAYAGTGGVSHSPDCPPVQPLMAGSLGVSKERVWDRDGKEVITLWKLMETRGCWFLLLIFLSSGWSCPSYQPPPLPNKMPMRLKSRHISRGSSFP